MAIQGLQKDSQKIAQSMIALKDKVTAEMLRRSHNITVGSATGGSLEEYGKGDWLYTNADKPVKDGIPKAVQANKIIAPLNAVHTSMEEVAEGTIMASLSQAETIVNNYAATDLYSEKNDCQGFCSGLCAVTCVGGCRQECSDTCTGTCKDSCDNTCKGGCKGSCTGSCKGGCYQTCTGQCGNCGNTCTGSCKNSCEKTCKGGCDTSCSLSCYTHCTTTCSKLCTDSCTGSCKYSCTGSCKSTCTSCSGSCKGSCIKTCASGGCTAECSNSGRFSF